MGPLDFNKTKALSVQFVNMSGQLVGSLMTAMKNTKSGRLWNVLDQTHHNKIENCGI